MSFHAHGGRPAADPAAVRAWLVGALARRAPDFAGAIGEDTALTEGGLGLDSLELADLLIEIEEALGVALDEADITPENLGTVGRAARFLAARGAVVPA